MDIVTLGRDVLVREFHLSGGDPLFPTTAGLLSLPHVHPHMPDCRHVLDIVLDSAGSRASPGDIGSHVFAHAAHPARQLAESSTARILHQGKLILSYRERVLTTFFYL